MIPRREAATSLPPLLLAAILAVLPPIAEAGNFSVSPVRIYMTPRDRATAITITNEGDDELVMQADIYNWKQKPGGEDDLAFSEDLFVAPPIIKLAPKARQVVRLAMVKPSGSPDQLTYRLIIREIAEARPAEKNLEVNIALAFSLPVFITPPAAKSQVSCEAARASRDTLSVTCRNEGNAHALLRDMTLESAGKRIASREAVGYVLPGIRRSFELKRADGAIPAGPAKVGVAFDDGATKTFDVAIPE